MIFEHTAKERGLWRGWLKNGQSVELSWRKRGWDFGAGVHIHSNDADLGDRMLCVKFWRFTAFLPLGIVPHPWPAMDGPQWSVYASGEFGLAFRWGLRGKSFDWPWFWHTLRYEQQMADGSWREVGWANRDGVFKEHYGYTYVLRSGKVQERIATVSRRRHVLTFAGLKRIGWPRWTKHSIDIEFNGEVGERSGSWKGGCIGCSYDLRPNEGMKQALARMEAERVFE